jgi:predicted Rossmann fold flavoprotein
LNAADVIIIGAGPAGLMCAVRCAAAGLSVLVLEKNSTAGKKLLITGSGRCNLTHSGAIRDFLTRYGEKGRFVKGALLNFTNLDLREFFERLGLNTVEEDDGKIFPVTNRSGDVATALVDECARLGVAIGYGARVTAVRVAENGFDVFNGDVKYRGATVVIAAGGASYPLTGSCGDGYAIAEKLGHSIVDIAPALAPVVIKDYGYRACAGISFPNAPLSLNRAGKKVHESNGDVLFTHAGLSGPGILDLSRYTRADDVIKIALVADGREEVDKRLIGEFAKNGRLPVKKCFSPFKVPERLLLMLLSMCGVAPETNAASVSRAARAALVEALTGLPFVVQAIGGFSEAMVTRGGVALNEINPNTMESRIVRGLYLAGEVVDVDGDTGGYNLQCAFSSGALAPRGIASGVSAGAGR